MTDKRIKKIVIIGGGTAGWMSAAAISHIFKNKYANITLIESETIGTIGVGEATIPQILTFNNMLGIDENEFVKRTQATFKLGIEFVNWKHIGQRYIHPFGDYGIDMEGISFHHYWLKENQRRAQVGLSEINIEDYCIQAVAARHGKFMRPIKAERSILEKIVYAFQFDASLYAAYLRNFSEQRGVTRIEGRIVEAQQDSETGYIQSVNLDNGKQIDGDLFIDCSGFRGLLIEEKLHAGYKEWSNWLPCDRAVAVPCKSNGEPTPYTRATAHSAGWQWRIPLQHRIGNGHVFSSQFMSADEATKILLENLDGPAIRDPLQLRFTTGHRKKFWDKNVVSLGLAAGFLEPLESTSIHLVQSGLAKLMTLFPHNGINQIDIDYFNQQTTLEYERVRDFLILHYHATERTDSEFWNYCRNMNVPDFLKTKMELFKKSGRIFRADDELFNETSWLAVFTGQGLDAQDYHPVADVLPATEIENRLGHIRDAVLKSAEVMPTHAQFIKENCQASSVNM